MTKDQLSKTVLTQPVAPQVTQALANAVQELLSGAEGATGRATEALATYQAAAQSDPGSDASEEARWRVEVTLLTGETVEVDATAWLLTACENDLVYFEEHNYAMDRVKDAKLIKEMLDGWSITLDDAVLAISDVDCIRIEPDLAWNALRTHRIEMWAALLCHSHDAMLVQWPTGEWYWLKRGPHPVRVKFHATAELAALDCERHEAAITEKV